MVFCGIDIGTTSTKAVVLDRDGWVVDEMALPAPAADEAYWHEHFCHVLDFFAQRGRFRGEEIACSVTGQGGSFVLTDSVFRPVGDACSWTELADDAVVRDMIDTFGESGYYHRTGWPPHGWLAACKLKQRVGPEEIGGCIRHVATVPDFVYAQLTGELCTDITSAQITGLADFQRTRWSSDILDWAGVSEALLPPIQPGLNVLREGLRTGWGKLTLVTGSHDQYAAMEAAGLVKDISVMLGTGTAWVINGRTSRPLFDERRFRIHPGTDLHPECCGFIISLWQIGAGFDKLLHRLGVTRGSLPGLEDAAVNADVPRACVKVDLDTGAVEPAGDAALSVRRYMEWSGSVVAHALDACGLGRGLKKIVVAGGAMSSRLWPHVIANICDLTVEAVECPPFTAYGAALHARAALLGPLEPHRFPSTAVVRTYTPQHPREYRAWYHDFQKPMLDAQGSSIL
jgi:sugar (pentulose or hexulose) kinase